MKQKKTVSGFGPLNAINSLATSLHTLQRLSFFFFLWGGNNTSSRGGGGWGIKETCWAFFNVRTHALRRIIKTRCAKKTAPGSGIAVKRGSSSRTAKQVIRHKKERRRGEQHTNERTKIMCTDSDVGEAWLRLTLPKCQSLMPLQYDDKCYTTHKNSIIKNDAQVEKKKKWTFDPKINLIS